MVGNNVGKLTKWLRIRGYDTLFLGGSNNANMVQITLDEGRIILTRNTQIMERRVVTSGKLKAVLITSNDSKRQIHQATATLNLNCQFRPCAICLECNQLLVKKRPEQITDLVPPYVFQTQSQHMECPTCHRIYWSGTHWQAMAKTLQKCGKG